MHPDFPRVAASQLEATVERGLRRERFRSWVLLLMTLGVAAYWLDRFAASMPWLGAGLFLFSAFTILVQSGLPDGVALEQAKPDLLGQYSRADVERILREVCASYGEDEIPQVYILESGEGTAMVVNVDLLNFVKPWNALYLGQHFLHILDEKELKALLAHELCHFSLHYSVGTRFFYLRAAGHAVWVTTALSFPLRWWENLAGDGALFWIGLGIALWLGLVKLPWWIAQILANLVTNWSSRTDDQEVEALCDLEAARRFGAVPMINTLLKLGTRQEIYLAVMTALSPDRNRPLGWTESASDERDGDDAAQETREKQWQTQGEAIERAIEKLEELLPPGFLSVEQAAPYIEQAVQAGLQDHEARRFLHPPRRLLRWLDYDVRVQDRRLDARELQGLLRDMDRDPGRPLLDLPEEVDPDLAARAEHPTTRNRILFLAHNLDLGSL